MEVIQCLENIVGVSDLPCNCVAEDRPENYNTSRSGKFLSDLVDLKLIGNAGDCGAGKVWDIGSRAINTATLALQTNLPNCWASRKKNQARRPYIGALAQIVSNKSLKPRSRYAGVRITPHAHIEDATLVLNRIGTVFTQQGVDVLAVEVYDEEELLVAFDLDTENKKFQRNDLEEPLVIPFKKEGVPHQSIYIIYEVGANLPRNNEMICDCTSTLKNHIAQWVSVEGITGDDLDLRSEWACDDLLAYGLVPDVHMKCDILKAICKEELDFTSDPFAGTIAEYIHYSAASILIGNVMASTDANVFTLHPMEVLAMRRNEYNAEARARMANLCENMDPGSCFACKSDGQMMTLGG